MSKQNTQNRSVFYLFAPSSRLVSFFLALLSAVLFLSCGEEQNRKQIPFSERVIVLDPGHGFSDPGAMAGEVREKDITLAVSLLIRDELLSKGFQVVMTREDDTPPAGEDDSFSMKPSMRVEFAQSLDSFDLFLSIHADSFVSDPSVKGTRLYYYTGGDRSAERLCSILKDDIHASLARKMPSVKAMSSSEAYTVLYKIRSAPSVLIETGFLTNTEDLASLVDPDWQRRFAAAVADGVAEFFGG